MDSKSRLGMTILICSLILTAHTGCTGSGDGSLLGGNSDLISQAVSVSPVGGTAPLAVTANANASNIDTSGLISSYRWDFGDGTTANSAVANHTYTTAGTYPITLTVTNSEGTEFTISDTVYVYNTINNAGAAPTAVIFDAFEYSVARTDTPSDPTGQNNPFTNSGPWTAVKAINVTGSYNGYLYTTTSIPGYAGTFPGRNSTSVLAMEALPKTLGGQTDFYLQYGDILFPTTTVPGDVWFQFWIYANRYNDPNDQNDQLSAYEGRFKFIYPCNGSYPCQEGQLKWLNTLGYTTGEPFWANENYTELFMTTVDPYNTAIDYQAALPENQFKIGHSDVSENIRPHRWTLVKIHYNTAAPQGTYEAWMRPLGDTQWVQVADWRGGVTANFSWPIAQQGGHRVFRMPTTINDEDSWIYLDDFVMATADGDLPVYSY